MYKYNYDNKYQLLGANWGVPDFSNNIFTTPTNSYSETVTNGYDANGNIQGLTRTNNVGATVDDNFSSYQYQTSTNKLNTVGNNTNPTAYASYTYDELGELKSMQKTGEAFTYYLKYDVTGKITGIYADALLTQLKIGYTYDESGNRISRTDNTTVTPSTNYYVYDASGNSIATYNGTTLAEMPFYGVDRLGTYTLASNNYVYELKDNVGSVRAVINQNKKSDGTADVIAYNDYYPFGSIAQSANSTGYKYEYQGAYAEKDDVTGFNNFELRMYDGKIGRWLSTDPAGQYASPYEGMGNNPVTGLDQNGAFSWFGAHWYALWHGGEIDKSSSGKNAGEYFVFTQKESEDGLGVSGNRNFGPQDYKTPDLNFGNTITFLNNIGNPTVMNSNYFRLSTQQFTGHIIGKEGNVGTSNVNISNEDAVDADVSLGPLGAGQNGISLTIGMGTHGVGVSKSGFTYTRYIKENGNIHGQTTTLTPKLTTIATGALSFAGQQIMHLFKEIKSNPSETVTDLAL